MAIHLPFISENIECLKMLFKRGAIMTKKKPNNKYVFDDLCNELFILPCRIQEIWIYNKNKTIHPISSNSHPSATVNKAIHSLNWGGGHKINRNIIQETSTKMYTSL